MSPQITAADYFGPYANHADATAERRYHAVALLDVVNDLLEIAEADGCDLPNNPNTGSRISGNGNGGFRPQGSKVGADNSKHKDGRGIDIYDPRRKFASWCLAHPDELKKRGLHMEDPRWTVTLDKRGKIVGGWVHLQDVPPGSGRLVYIPSVTPALASAPAEWSAVA